MTQKIIPFAKALLLICIFSLCIHVQHSTQNAWAEVETDFSYIAPLEDSRASLQERIHIIRQLQAGDEFCFTTAMFTDDAVGRTLMYELAQAADRGVVVRGIIDPALNYLPDKYFVYLQNHGVTLREFHPMGEKALDKAKTLVTKGARRLNNRSHDKISVGKFKKSDGTFDYVMIEGSRNFVDSHFGLDRTGLHPKIKITLKNINGENVEKTVLYTQDIYKQIQSIKLKRTGSRVDFLGETIEVNQYNYDAIKKATKGLPPPPTLSADEEVLMRLRALGEQFYDEDFIVRGKVAEDVFEYHNRVFNGEHVAERFVGERITLQLNQQQKTVHYTAELDSEIKAIQNAKIGDRVSIAGVSEVEVTPTLQENLAKAIQNKKMGKPDVLASKKAKSAPNSKTNKNAKMKKVLPATVGEMTQSELAQWIREGHDDILNHLGIFERVDDFNPFTFDDTNTKNAQKAKIKFYYDEMVSPGGRRGPTPQGSEQALLDGIYQANGADTIKLTLNGETKEVLYTADLHEQINKIKNTPVDVGKKVTIAGVTDVEVTNQLLRDLQRATEGKRVGDVLYMMSQYGVLTPEMEQAFAKASARGVDVRLVVNGPLSMWDSQIPIWGYEHTFDQLVGTKIHVREYSGHRQLHFKAITVSNPIEGPRYTVLGSSNLDPRSLTKMDEKILKYLSKMGLSGMRNSELNFIAFSEAFTHQIESKIATIFHTSNTVAKNGQAFVVRKCTGPKILIMGLFKKFI